MSPRRRLHAPPVPGTVKVRLWGLPADCAEAATQVAGTLDVISQTEPHPDDGNPGLVRVFLEARIP